MRGIGLENFIWNKGNVHIEADTLGLYDLTDEQRSTLVTYLLEDLNFMQRDTVIIIDQKLVVGYLRRLRRQYTLPRHVINKIQHEALISIQDIADTLFNSGCKLGHYELSSLTDNSLTIEYSESNKWRP